MNQAALHSNRLFLFTCFALAAVMPMQTSAADPATTGQPKIIMPTRGICAHRGANKTHPENTLSAFREAVRLGVHQIEFDVRLSSDKHLVIMHDTTVNRTTDGKGPIAKMTLAQIKKLDAGSWKHPSMAGERVPTLRETLSVMPRDVWLNCHLKGGPEVARAVTKILVKTGRQHQAFLACGRRSADAARKVFPGVLICNMERQGHDTAYVKATIAHHDAFLQLWGDMASGPDMALLKSAGVRVNYCCVNDPSALKAMFVGGVQFPLVDDVRPMIQAATALGIKPWKSKHFVGNKP